MSSNDKNRPPKRVPIEAKRRVTANDGEARHTPERLKTKGSKLTPSSRAWLERQLSDPYVQKAKREGWRSRAAFKLIEIDEKTGLVKKGARVVDLGAAPGGWSQYVVKKGARAVVAIDLLEIEPIACVEIILGDFLDETAPEQILNLLGGPPDLVLSDMAADTTGHRQTDHLRTAALFEAAADFALEHVAPGGAFCGKVFQGGAEAAILARLKQGFDKVKHIKPPASRKESPELFVVAQGRKPKD
jgi:23S rRNA (uridine2552-2'-O)-methyltransferase